MFRTAELFPVALALSLAACAGGSSTGGDTAAASLGERASFGTISYQVPAAWTEQPGGGMRRAQYAIPAAPGDAEGGECALYHFPGQGGSVDANLQRWYAQFQQPDGGSSEAKARVENFTAGGFPVTYVDVSGTYIASMGPMTAGGEPKPGYRMLAGVIETAQGPWFLKCVGPESTIESSASGMKALLMSVRP